MTAPDLRALVERFEKAVRGHEHAIVDGHALAVIFDESQERSNARAALLAYGEAVEREKECCRWTYMDWPASNGDYETPCKGGGAWSFNDGDLASNGVIYCPFCGGKIVAPEEPNSCCECGEEHDGEAATCARCQDEIDKQDADTRPTEARDS